jgi:UDP-N-acetyl-D-mannosaminuronic acid dehydrogenase
MPNEFKRVSVVGLGYIGLPTAAVIAGRSVDVVGIDVDPHVVETINRGDVHIVEPELDIVVRAAVLSGRLRASLEPEPADVFVIAVPTPFKDDHEPDLSYIETATRSIAPFLRAGNLLILESTSPVGTTEQMLKWLAALRPDLRLPTEGVDGADINVAYCPERVLPGQVLRELVENDRVVGGITPACAQRAASFYRLFVRGECVTTNARTAEMAKLTENAFRDVNIAFANELSLICERQAINVWELIRLANRHPRVNILQPGPGVGGHCIAVDPWFIVHSSPELSPLIRTAREVNDGKPHWVLDKVRQAIKNVKGRPVVACLGLAFKPDIDDLRESPALHIAATLASESICHVLAVEPFVTKLPTALSNWPHVELMTAQAAVAAADVVVLLVNHSAFNAIDRRSLAGKIVIDTRGLWG